MKKFNKKISALLSATLFLAATANCQNTKDMTFSRNEVVADSVPEERPAPKNEFGIGGGIVVYQGDLAPTLWGAYKSPMLGVQLHYTRLLSPAFALRVGATVGKFGADDVKSAFKQAYRDYRKYNFKTSFAELSLVAQWTPFARANWRLNPYIMGGIGGTYVQVKNDWSKSEFNYFPGENLPQRISEDSVKEHTFIAPVLPVGVGLKYDVNSRVAFRLEWINRITFTDYLDGFSKSANPNKNDRYSTIMLTVNFAFGRNKSSKTYYSGSNVINNYYYYNNTKNSKSENSMAVNNGTDNANTENAKMLRDIQNKLNSITEKVNRGPEPGGNEGNEQDDLAKFEKYIIYFSFDHSYLEGESFNKLDAIANMMKADPKLNVTLNGYTDLKGASDYNMKLSSARAVTCKDYLQSRGIDASRIKTEAFGKTRYVVSKGTAAQQWINRRVEVYIN
jgi:outer membrane protein OmpA-like peptidoglycan-associated protein